MLAPPLLDRSSLPLRVGGLGRAAETGEELRALLGAASARRDGYVLALKPPRRGLRRRAAALLPWCRGGDAGTAHLAVQLGARAECVLQAVLQARPRPSLARDPFV
jgi:hypothetical protein